MSVLIHPGMKIDSAPANGKRRHAYGTLGFFASIIGVDDDPTPQYLITNAHVLASPSFNPKVGDHVLCADSGAKIATLQAWTALNSKFILTSDVAVARLEQGFSVSNEIPTLSEISGLSNHIGVGSTLYSYGAETKELRTTTVRSVNLNNVTGIQFTTDGKDAFRLTNLFACDRYSQSGDSGSPIVNRWGRLVGMHVARRGEGVSARSMAASVKSVLQAASAVLDLGSKLTVWHQTNNSTDLLARENIRSLNELANQHSYEE